MKQRACITFLPKVLYILLLSTSILYCQEEKEVHLIQSQSNIQELQRMETRFSRESQKQQAEVERLVRLGNKRIIETQDGSYSELVGSNELGKPVYLLTANQVVVNTLKANTLYTNFDGSINITGRGIKIGLWENGSPRLLHEIFREGAKPNYQSRIEYVLGEKNPLLVQRHATHVSGTIIGNQLDPSASSPTNSLVRGVAFESTIKAWDWLNVELEMTKAAKNDGMIIANTSFGFNPNYLHTVEFGRYGPTAAAWDEIMCNAPYFQIVKSVGNARDDNPAIVPQVIAKGGFDLLEGGGTAKNVLTIGSVNLSSATLTDGAYQFNQIDEPYSSWGPTDDGRIKPDLSAHGYSVLSSIQNQNNAYANYSGTSMAAAGISGGVALLQYYWHKVFGCLYGRDAAPYMWSSTVRALLIHSADEIGSKGPDYQYGWGVANLETAATTIKNRGKSVIIREDVLENEKDFVLNVAASGKEELKVTLAWTDPAGVPNTITLNPNNYIDDTTHKLINNLDIKLVRLNAAENELIDADFLPDQNVLLPWKRLDGISNTVTDLRIDAIHGINNVDNVEKIQVPVANASETGYVPKSGGLYRIVISHKNKPLANSCTQVGQAFSLIVSGVSFCENDIVFYQHEDDFKTEAGGALVRAKTITASDVVEASSNSATNESFVEFQAKDYIELLPQTRNEETGAVGFTAVGGSDFLAHIICESPVRCAYSSREIRSLLEDTTIDITREVREKGVIIFPNPIITDILNIQFTLSKSSNFDIEIYDLGGIKLFEEKSTQNYLAGTHKKAIDVNKLEKGIFVVRTISADGVHSFKLIKK